MQFSLFTDLTIRTLLALAQRRKHPQLGWVTVSELSMLFNCSEHHLVKVVHNLSKLGWIHAHRGKGGGLELAKDADQYSFGVVLRELEAKSAIIDCSKNVCPFLGKCRVKKELAVGQEKFFEHFDQFTLQDFLD